MDSLITLSMKLSTSVKKLHYSYNNILVRWVYKHCALELASVIADLVNITLSTGRAPHVGKTHRSHPYQKCRRWRVLLSYGQYLSRRFSVENSAEKLIVRKYIMPALPLESMSDQFAYRPTGATSAAFVSLTHAVAQTLETRTSVRCLLIG